MGRQKQYNKVKYSLSNFKCDKCDTGIVQIISQSKRGGMVTTSVSGCLDCDHDYGIQQAMKLKVLPDNYEMRWA